MDRAAFTHMAATETTHWWFVGRRAVIDALLDGVDLPASGAILEVGCGTGGNLASLARRGRIQAFEPHIDALAFARERHPGMDIRQGALPDELPYEKGSFDLVGALDVLEHVEDDQRSAEALVQLTRPGGWLLVTVPAHQALWGSHDRRLHHRRRYGRDQLLDLFSGARRSVGARDSVQHRPFAARGCLSGWGAGAGARSRKSGTHTTPCSQPSSGRGILLRSGIRPKTTADPIRAFVRSHLPATALGHQVAQVERDRLNLWRLGMASATRTLET